MFPKSDHCDGERFFNPDGYAGPQLPNVARMLLEKHAKWPDRIDEPPQRPLALGDAAAVVTFIGHATFLIQTAAGNILTDPMFSQHAGPFDRFGPKRVRQPAVRIGDLPPISLVLLSHNHYDHCDTPTLRLLAERFDPLVVTPLGNGPLMQSAGIKRVEELDWWEASKTSPLPITVTPAHHFSRRGPFDQCLALWGGFMITAGRKRIYFTGDTGYGPFFRDIRQRLGSIDLALLPIGAYEPRWFMQPLHMNPAEAVQTHLDLGAPESIAMHFGTFQLTTEGIDDPLRALEEARRVNNVSPDRFRAIGFGESVRCG